MKSSRRNLKAAFAVLAALGFPATGFGAIFDVTTTVDAVDANIGDGNCDIGGGLCSLRAAVQEANASSGIADTINVPGGKYVLVLAGDNGENDPASGDLDVEGLVTIISSAGPDNTIIDGNAKSRVFEIWPGEEKATGVVIDGLTIQNGIMAENSRGGGIRQRPFTQLTVRNSTIAYNRASADGGGIFSDVGPGGTASPKSILNIEDSAIIHNRSAFGAGIVVNETELNIKNSLISHNRGISYPPGNIFGGGVAIFNGFEKSRIENSTISHNDATNGGGGIYVSAGELVMVNSTVSRNTSNYNGGGVYFRGDKNATVYDSKFINVTIADNTARGIYNQRPEDGAGGGGLYLDPRGGLSIQNVLFSGNIGGDCIVSEFMVSNGNNIDSDGTCGLTQSTDLSAEVNINLGDLDNNDGPTETHALLLGSVAIDAGDNAVCNSSDIGSVDQRYYQRSDGQCDIGAFEYTSSTGGATPLPGTNPDQPDLPERYQLPLAFGLPYTVAPGGVVAGIFNGATFDFETPLTYEITVQPTKGIIVGGVDTSFIPEAFTYTANPDASGSDFVKFRACDIWDGCSEEATVTFFIVSDEPATESVRLDIVNDTGGTVTNPTGVQVFAQTAVEVAAPDIDYDFPLGAFFFTLDNIPKDPGTTDPGSTEVVIELPAGEIAENAVVRKLDIRNEWRTLPTSAPPGSRMSTGVINHTARTITLTLYDNDNAFDRNPIEGVIDDPVAIGVPRAAAPAPEEVGVSPAPAATGGGGGSLAWFLAMGILPLVMWRLKRPF